MKVRILGSGDAFGSGGRLQSGAVVSGASFTALVDCGATCLPAMKRQGIRTGEIETVLVTHLHGDHFGGLPYFFLDAHYVDRRAEPLELMGPPGLETALETLMETLYPGSWAKTRSFPVRFRTLVPGEVASLPGARVQAFEVRHSAPPLCLALRIEADRGAIGFSGDTEWCPGLLEAADGCDLFFCECSSPSPIPNHLSLEELAARRGALRCRRLILTHLGPLDPDAVTSAGLEPAFDGMVIEL